jgi:hypothetical protein
MSERKAVSDLICRVMKGRYLRPLFDEAAQHAWEAALNNPPPVAPPNPPPVAPPNPLPVARPKRARVKKEGLIGAAVIDIQEQIRLVYDEFEKAGKKPPASDDLPKLVQPRLAERRLKASGRDIIAESKEQEFKDRRLQRGQRWNGRRKS